MTMIAQIVLLFALLAYSMIASQSFMYLISLKSVQMKLDAQAYAQVRKLIDASMRANFKYVVYAALATSLLLALLNARAPSSLMFAMAVVAFLALVLDTVLMMKGNVPINEAINAWSEGNIPSDWARYRDQWLRIFGYRQLANLLGFLALLIGTVFGAK